MTTFPETHNPLLANYFQFVLNRVPNMVYFCQSAILPGVVSTMDFQPTSLGYPIKVPTGATRFEDLTLTFKVDENLTNWLEIKNWAEGLGNYSDDADTLPYHNVRNLVKNGKTSEGRLLITNSSYKPKFAVNFRRLFPLSLSGIQFRATEVESVEVVGTVIFSFTDYTVEKLVNP